MAKPLYIHKANFMWRRGTRVDLDGVYVIFTCPLPDDECEYIMANRTEEEAIAIRDTHMARVHPTDCATMRWEEAFGDLPDFVQRVLAD